MLFNNHSHRRNWHSCAVYLCFVLVCVHRYRGDIIDVQKYYTELHKNQ